MTSMINGVVDAFEQGGWGMWPILFWSILTIAIIVERALYLFGSHISPLTSASTHILPDPVRTRKLLLHAAEISKLIIKVQRAGYTLMPLNMHFKGGRVKLEIGLAKGKKQHDKRATERERDASREAQQAMKKDRR